MNAYRYNQETGIYECEQPCQRDPLESKGQGKEVFLLPANCTYEHPLIAKDGFDVVWNGEAWEYREQPQEPAPEPTPDPTPEEQQAALIASYTNAVQQRLDAFARERGYDDMNSLVSYVGDESPRFAAEAATGKRLRSQTWTLCYAILADVQAGKRAAPTLEELLAELPVLAWE